MVLTATGQARAVNYGFANERTLLAQVDEALAAAPSARHIAAAS